MENSFHKGESLDLLYQHCIAEVFLRHKCILKFLAASLKNKCTVNFKLPNIIKIHFSMLSKQKIEIFFVLFTLSLWNSVCILHYGTSLFRLSHILSAWYNMCLVASILGSKLRHHYGHLLSPWLSHFLLYGLFFFISVKKRTSLETLFQSF